MSTFEKPCYGTYITGGDLRNSLYEAVALNAAGRIEKAGTATSVVIGVLAQNPEGSAAGEAVTVALINGSDKLLVKAQAAIPSGHLLVPNVTNAGEAQGVPNLTAIVSGAMSFGIALEAAAARGEVIQFKCQSLAGSA